MSPRDLRPVCIIVGALAALRAPRWIEQQKLTTLLAGWSGMEQPDESAQCALRWSYRAVRVLARLPGGYWKYTCLYRSVAGALVLRHFGVASRLHIGARSEAGEIKAHAWLNLPDGAPQPYEPLTSAGFGPAS